MKLRIQSLKRVVLICQLEVVNENVSHTIMSFVLNILQTMSIVLSHNHVFCFEHFPDHVYCLFS